MFHEKSRLFGFPSAIINFRMLCCQYLRKSNSQLQFCLILLVVYLTKFVHRINTMKKKSMPFLREKSVGRLNASPSKNAGSNVVANTTEDEQKFNEEKKTDKDKSFVVKITARVSRSEKKRDAEKNQGDGEDEVAKKNEGDVKDEVTDKNEEDVKDGVDKTEAAEENTLQKEKFLGERVSEKIGHADKINKEKSFVEKITARVSRSDKKGKAEKNQEHVKDEVAAKKEEEIQVEVADHTEAAEVKAFKKEKSFVGRISEKVGHADKKGDAADTVKHKVKEADLIYEKMDAVLETLSKALLEQHKAMKGADERKIEVCYVDNQFYFIFQFSNLVLNVCTCRL